MLYKFSKRLFQAWVADNPPLFLQWARFFLLPASIVNVCIQRLRIFFYDIGVFKKQRLGAKVISVGNLTMGGSGKTPTTALIAETLLQNGLKPAILSRGYGGQRKTKSPVVISDGKKILTEQKISGDEPYLLAKKLQGVPVIVGGDRVASGKEALNQFQCKTIILDDGYQHVRLERDVDLCLIDCDAGSVFEDKVFPSGMLREPVSQLARADAFLLTHWQNTAKSRNLEKKLEESYKKPIFRSRHTPFAWIDSGSGRELDLGDMEGKKFLAFCGIAKPQSFLTCLETYKPGLVSFLTYPDHNDYSHDEVTSIQSEGERLGVDLIVTTEKDWVKLEGRADFSVPLWVLRIKVEILEEHSFLSLF